MRKVIVTMFMVVISASIVLTGCTKKAEEPKKETLKVGMVTDSGSIDDKSFNQGTWEGILGAEKDFGVETKYLKPAGQSEADLLKEIQNLYDAGFKFIITPGFSFGTAIYASQEKYPDAKFVIIDAIPSAPDGKGVIGSNTVSCFYTEEESGFIAGVATALQLKDAEVAFIGGMAIPAVQKFNWGFQQGVAYSNENFDTKVVMNEENFVYQGSFDDVAGGAQLAASMFDKGVDAIFCAAGGVGAGAINEAVTRAKGGEEVWIVGVDGDQYHLGAYGDNKSVILTSAMKKLNAASYDMIKAELDGKFPGGQSLMFDASNNSIGLPNDNPNLDASVEAEVAKVFEKVVSGTIVVSKEQGNLFK